MHGRKYHTYYVEYMLHKVLEKCLSMLTDFFMRSLQDFNKFPSFALTVCLLDYLKSRKQASIKFVWSTDWMTNWLFQNILFYIKSVPETWETLWHQTECESSINRTTDSKNCDKTKQLLHLWSQFTVLYSP